MASKSFWENFFQDVENVTVTKAQLDKAFLLCKDREAVSVLFGFSYVGFADNILELVYYVVSGRSHQKVMSVLTRAKESWKAAEQPNKTILLDNLLSVCPSGQLDRYNYGQLVFYTNKIENENGEVVEWNEDE